MNIDNFKTGSLDARLKDIAVKFEQMKKLINDCLVTSCLQLNIEPLYLSATEYRDPNKLFAQYFDVVDIEYCKANKKAISSICSDLQRYLGSLQLAFDNNGRVQFLTHVDEKLGFIIEIYLG